MPEVEKAEGELIVSRWLLANVNIGLKQSREM
jgi:hypothetical protein